MKRWYLLKKVAVVTDTSFLKIRYLKQYLKIIILKYQIKDALNLTIYCWNLVLRSIETDEFPDDSALISNLKFDDKYKPMNIIATEKHTKPKSRFTEASLVK